MRDGFLNLEYIFQAQQSRKQNATIMKWIFTE